MLDCEIIYIYIYIYIKLKWSRYRPGVAQRVGRGIALLFHDCGTRKGWVVSSTPRPHFSLEKDPVSILQEAGWAPGPVWTVGKSHLHGDSIPDRPSCSQSLYRLSYPTHTHTYIYICIYILLITEHSGDVSPVSMFVILWFQVKARGSRARFTKTNSLQLCGVVTMIYDSLA